MADERSVVSGDGSERSATKYGDRLENHTWAESRRDSGADESASIPPAGLTLEIIHVHDPDQEYGFGRRKYELHVSPPTENRDGTWYVLYATTHRWKGNYWRKDGEADWADLPGIVKAKAGETLPVDSPSNLDPGVRTVGLDEGGVRSSTGNQQEATDE